jgi:hypothetical protein
MSAADLIGTTLDDRYRIVDVIGVGGMGTVYAAEHLKLGRTVAIKMLRDEFRGDPGLRARFMGEARAMAEIGHEHIVSVLDIGEAPNGSLYFVMEHLRGEDLADTLARDGKLPWPRVRGIGLQLCLALAACHDKKIIHRDLKPPNCFMVARVDGSDYVKILDFGIAKTLAGAGRRVTDPQGMHRVDSRRWQHTISGEVFGTMAYMSPEHFFGEAVDHRTDIYALGVILYEMLTGTTPLAAENIGNYAEELRYLDPTPPSKAAPGAKIPADVDYLVLRALAKKPEDRFASMKELGLALAEAREDRPVAPLGGPPPTGGESGSTTMVWSRPDAQAALARVLGTAEPVRWTRDRRVWLAIAGLAGVAIMAAVLAVVLPMTCAAEVEAEAPRVAAPTIAAASATVTEAPRAVGLPAQVDVPGPVVARPAAAEEAEEGRPTQLPRCPPVTAAEWARMLEPIAAQAQQCKRELGVTGPIKVALAVGAVGGRVTAETMPRSGKLLEAAKCIRKHVIGRLKLPAKLQACRLPRAPQYF